MEKYTQKEKKKLGNKIKKARNKNGLTLKELGGKIGYSYSLISEWENGKKNPSALTLIKLAKFLKFDI